MFRGTCGNVPEMKQNAGHVCLYVCLFIDFQLLAVVESRPLTKFDRVASL